MKTSTRRTICGRFALFAICVAIFAVATMLIIQSAHAQDSLQSLEEAQQLEQIATSEENFYTNEAGEIVTKIYKTDGADTGIELVGARKAKMSDYLVYKDYSVWVSCSDLAVQGKAKNGIQDIGISNPNISIRNLDVDAVCFYVGILEKIKSNAADNEVNITIEDGCTLNTKAIHVKEPKNNNEGEIGLIFNGSGNLEVIGDNAKTQNGFIQWSFGDLIFDGPNVHVDNILYNNGPAIGDGDNGDIIFKSGKVIIESELVPAVHAYTNPNNTIKIMDDCELFAVYKKSKVGSHASVMESNKTIEFTPGSILGSSSVYSYDQRNLLKDIVTCDNSIKSRSYMLLTGDAPALTIYHSGVKPEIKEIAVETMPTKTEYLVGEPFDKTGLTVTKTFVDGTSETYTPEDAEISGFDSSTPGEKTVTVTCNADEANEALTTSFTVTVKAASEEPGASPASGSTQTGDSNALAILCALVALAAASSVVWKRSRN